MKRSMIVLLTLVGFGPTTGICSAQPGIYSHFPRLGLTFADWQPGSLLVLADSDEGLLVSELPGTGSVYQFSIFDDVFFPAPDSIAPLTPGDLDSGDYAYAVAILRPEVTSNPLGYEVEAFFQLRLAGSTATALTGVAGTPDPGTDPQVPVDLIDDQIITTFGSLAGMAVAQARWSDVDDYIEFQPQFALADYFGPPTAGPGAWGQSVFPEPTSAALVLLSILGCGSFGRRLL